MTPAVFIVGITGAVGGLLAQRLVDDGRTVRGLVRRGDQHDQWQERGVSTVVGDLGSMPVADLERALRGSTAVIFAAGSNGGDRATTDAIDRDGLGKTIAAARTADVDRFLLLSVLPEAWRERNLDDDVEHYFAVKKQAEVDLVHSGLDWSILRPSLLTDDPGTGTVSLSPAELHGHVARADVAATLQALLDEPRLRRRILELDHGTTPIADAVTHLASESSSLQARARP